MQQISCTEIDSFRKLKAYMVDRGFNMKSDEALADVILSIIDMNQDMLQEAVLLNNTCHEALTDQCRLALARFEVEDRRMEDMMAELKRSRPRIKQYVMPMLYGKAVTPSLSQYQHIMTDPNIDVIDLMKRLFKP